MTCAHCCGNYGPRGRDMSMEVFEAAVSKLDAYSIQLGGGEPTMHPRFVEILFKCLGTPDTESIWLATNGSQTAISIALAKMARAGVISVALSRDQYHDPIDPKVIKAFEGADKRYPSKPDNDCRAIRSVTRVVRQGRATWGIPDCCCEGVMVLPDGVVRHCGCVKSKTYGNVLDPGFRLKQDPLRADECWFSKKYARQRQRGGFPDRWGQ